MGSGQRELVLVVTVGGSPEPIITAIGTRRPDRCVFVCSEKSREQVPQIQEKTRRKTVYADESVIVDPDDLDGLFAECCRVIEREQRAGRDVAVDYTGGTKSMTAALLQAAIVLGAEPYLTTGERTDASRVRAGESTRRVAMAEFHGEWCWRTQLPGLLERFDYPAAEAVVRSVLDRHGAGAKLDALVPVIAGLAAWDRFAHPEADDVLRPLKKSLGVLFSFFANAREEREALESAKSAQPGEGSPKREPLGYLVADLIRNAERRAAAGRYDDAVGRLYRALELWAQMLLLSRHGITTARVDLEELLQRAPQLRETDLAARSSPAKLGLIDAWDVLSALDNSEGVVLYRRERDSLRTGLGVRNSSLFAHGFTPIDEAGWRDVERRIGGFLRVSLRAEGLADELWPQLPNDIGWFAQVAGRAPDSGSPTT